MAASRETPTYSCKTFSVSGCTGNPSITDHAYSLYKTIAKGHQQLADLERSRASAVNETLSDEISYELKNCESTQVQIE